MKIISKNQAMVAKINGPALSDPIGTTNILRGYIHPSDRANRAN
jgi:hypothetical protein